VGVGEKFAEGGFSVHDAFPGDEFSGSLVVGGFSEKVSGVGTGVPL
jgi:hypothetical protein